MRLAALAASFMSCLATTTGAPEFGLDVMLYEDILAETSAEMWARFGELQVMLVESGPDKKALEDLNFGPMFGELLLETEEKAEDIDSLIDGVVQVLLFLPDATPRIARERRLLKSILTSLLSLGENRPGKPEERIEIRLTKFVQRASEVIDRMLEKSCKEKLSNEAQVKLRLHKLGLQTILLQEELATIKNTIDQDVNLSNPRFAESIKFLFPAWKELVDALPYKSGVDDVNFMSRTIEVMSGELEILEIRVKSAQLTHI
jgi:hypothetical protein